LDGGHNPQCVRSIVSNLQQYFPGRKATFLFGVMADKDYNQMLEIILPHAERIIAVAPDNPRAIPAERLAKYIQLKGFAYVTPCGGIAEGIEYAVGTVRKEDVICAFGSFYMAGAIRSYFGLS
jgi:dihydrofolate synthase/folylpolyglutamate synthase